MDSDTDNSIIVENSNPKIDLKLVEKAINALLKHEAVRPKKVNNDLLLVDQPVTIWLIITTFKFSDKPKLKPVSIPLKHPLYGSSTEICLITKDPQRTYKEWVKTHEVKRVQKVLGVSKLRKKYTPYEAKRNLCDSYDLFLVDERVLPLMPKMLGKYFFEKKKQPVPVNISKETIFKKEILKACHCTYMHYRSGVCLPIKIGTTAMTSGQLLENLELAIPVVIDQIPRKWKNIQSLYIKTPESTSLPIYNCLPDLPIEIDPKDIKKETPKNYDDGIETEIKNNDFYNGESENEGEDEEDEENNLQEDDDMDEGEVDDDKYDDDKTDKEEAEDEEEKTVKKRKISKDTSNGKTSAVVLKNNKSSQVKNFPANKEEEKKGPFNIKDKEYVNKKEKSSSIKVIKVKKSSMKKGGDKAESNQASIGNKQKRSPKIMTADVSTNTSNDNEKAAKSAANFGNKKAIKKNVPEKKKEVKNADVKSIDNSEKKKIREKKKDKKNDSSKKKNVFVNKKGEQEKGISTNLSNNDNKRKRETSGQIEPNKKGVTNKK
ncbi:ribosomal protein L1p/L10e family-domain-containing protein [Glomus cerebriforme]|uniref:Ribosomal L1 domain-containing protein 1 n=1 Tax=Glomus cerebriforme TaxID=658196 RepID=A0A397TFX6_9GLOM|nr:ribosomal protein L1p/L10e family-domain-containing protein [Glomus cerebriforme]